MSDLIDAIALIVSFGAVAVSIIAFVKARPIEQKQYDVNAMEKVFEYLTDDSIRQAKINIARKYFKLKEQDKDKKAIFTRDIKQEAEKIKTAFDKTGVLYNLKLLDKNSFQIFDGNIIRTWLLLEDDISNDRLVNKSKCLSFV